MEHLAFALGLPDPTELRMNNLLAEGDNLLNNDRNPFRGENYTDEIVAELKQWAEYDDRVTAVQQFNAVRYR